MSIYNLKPFQSRVSAENQPSLSSILDIEFDQSKGVSSETQQNQSILHIILLKLILNLTISLKTLDSSSFILLNNLMKQD